MRREAAHFGAKLTGVLLVQPIPRKVICEKIDMHPSTFSRKINGVERFDDEEIFAIGLVFGEHAAKSGPAGCR